MRTTKICTCTLVAATLLMGTLSSCSKENSSETLSPKTFDVTLSFSSVGTRADGAAAVSGATVGIVNGYICFVTSGGAITDVYTISSSSTSGKNVNAGDLGSVPVILEDIPGASSRVYLIANKGSLPTDPIIGSSIFSYLSNDMKVEDQGDYTKVTSVGEAPLTPGATDDQKNAAITLSTRLSRIQIEEIGFDNNITGKIEGIYINGFYPTMQLDGTSGPWQSSIDPINYNDNSATFPSTYKTFVYDIVNKSIATRVVPTTSNGVWGYNLFASATPQMVIKLTDVVVDGTTPLDNPQFVTINGFKMSDNTPISQLEGGMIYTIRTGAIEIKYENITPQPGVTPISVHVTVIPVTWQETSVIPNL